MRAKGGPVGDTLGDESEPSNVTIAEKPLPSGWFRFSARSIQTVLSSPPGSTEAAVQRRYYYANIKTKQATWTRPDEDPYFLPESVYAAFNVMEHKNLRHLYDDVKIITCFFFIRPLTLKIGNGEYEQDYD